jgi:hypothetical protein
MTDYNSAVLEAMTHRARGNDAEFIDALMRMKRSDMVETIALVVFGIETSTVARNAILTIARQIRDAAAA